MTDTDPTADVNDDQEPETPDPAGDTPPGDEDANLADEVAKWKAMARKHEATAKANAAKARRLDEIEAASKSEAERLADAKAAADKATADALAEAALMRAAVKHGLTEADLELLGTGTPEEIEARAEKLAARLKATKARPDFGGGARGGDVGGKTQWSKSDLDGKTAAQIDAARKAGHLDRLMGRTQ